MRNSLLTAASAVLLVACAHGREDMRATTVTGETAPPTVEADAEREVLAIDSAPPAVESARRSRPRLSQTITLGEGTESQYTPSASAPTGGAGGSNVVVNNNIVVQQPGYGGYGGYGGFGYGVYGGGYGRAGVVNNDGRGGSRGASRQWGTTGWEGARRTAAPGQTPGVGGNWSPAPSYGPASMK